MADKKPTWFYEKLQEDGKVKAVHINQNDYDGKITGHFVFGVKEWFDEHPEERKRLGWVKHITHDTKDIEYNKQSQYLMEEVKVIDEYTCEDVYHVMYKTEDMMRNQEISNLEWNDGIVFYGGDFE